MATLTFEVEAYITPGIQKIEKQLNILNETGEKICESETRVDS